MKENEVEEVEEGISHMKVNEVEEVEEGISHMKMNEAEEVEEGISHMTLVSSNNDVEEVKDSVERDCLIETILEGAEVEGDIGTDIGYRRYSTGLLDKWSAVLSVARNRVQRKRRATLVYMVHWS